MVYCNTSHVTEIDEFIWSEFIRVPDDIKEAFYNLNIVQLEA
jgi:hypothetical protein